MSSIKYRSEIDGLRAFAIIPVLFFHLHEKLLPGGFIGVDVFFVISGYLITSLILKEYDAGKFSFYNFYARRIRRIFPALVVMAAGTILLCYWLQYGPDFGNAVYHGFASLLSFANFSHMNEAGDYWGFNAKSSPFLHAWSLSVEEQFYFIYPVLIIGIVKYFRKKAILLLGLLIVASYALFVYGVYYKPNFTFYMLPARGWELGAGGIASFIHKDIRLTKAKTFWSVAGLLFIVVAYFIIPGSSVLNLLPVAGTVLVILSTEGASTFITKILKNKVVVYIGKISYSLYLWHWPLLLLSKSFSSKYGLDVNPAVMLIPVFVISMLSYHFVEVLREKKHIVPQITAGWVIITAALFFLRSFEKHEDISMFNQAEWYGNIYNVMKTSDTQANKRNYGILFHTNPGITDSTFLTGGVIKLYGAGMPEIAVLGDSHILMWAKTLDETARELKRSVAFYGIDGVSPFFDIPPSLQNPEYLDNKLNKNAFNYARYQYLNLWKPKLVIITCRWDHYPEWTKNEWAQLDRYMKFLHSLGSKVLFIGQPPVLFFGDKNAPQYLSYLNMKPATGKNQYIRCDNSDKTQEGNRVFKELADKYPDVYFINPRNFYLRNSLAWALNASSVLYIDDDHLSYAGASLYRAQIFGKIENLLKQ